MVQLSRQPLCRLGADGFSLIELMVVVAILGILSAIAVPNFQRFMAKARQAEAKTNLNAIATLQESYYGDNDAYYTFSGSGVSAANIPALGFYTEGNPRYWYNSQSFGTFFVSNSMSIVDIRPGCGASGTTKDMWWHTNAPGAASGEILVGTEYNLKWGTSFPGLDCSTYSP